MAQLAHGASSMLGLGQAAVALSSLVRKRDISTLWELDPVAAPPRSVQQRLMGNDDEEAPSSTPDATDSAICESRCTTVTRLSSVQWPELRIQVVVKCMQSDM